MKVIRKKFEEQLNLKQISLVVDTYNQSMGGVDCSNQILTSYLTDQKQVKKWYKKYFFHMINTCVFHCHINASKIAYNKSQFNLREQLIDFIFRKQASGTK